MKAARVLMDKRHFSAAYYLAGLAVECRLKACIAKSFKASAWPDKAFVNRIHTHDFAALLGAADLKTEMMSSCQRSRLLELHRTILEGWKVDARYAVWSEAE